MDEPLSVDLGSICSPQETRDRRTNGNFHVAMFTAGAIRAFDPPLRVRRDPIPEGAKDGPNTAHALVYGTRKDAADNLIGGLTGGEYRKIANVAEVILDPTPEPAAGEQ